MPSGACGKLISQYLVPTQNVMLRQRFITFLMLPAGLLLAAVAFAAPKPNVILVTLDSVRADRVGFLGTASKTTPSLNAVARQSLVFEQAYAQAPLTVVSHATILSGTYPQTHQATEFGGPLAASVPVVADILRGQGYRTAAFVGSIELDPKNGLAPGFDRGFAEYNAGFHQPASNAARAPSYERRGSQVAARALTWINKSAAGPFFVWVNLHDADGVTTSQYRMGVAACDTAVGTLVAALRSKKLYDNSLIIVVSAHGESLGAHGEQAHGIFLYDETVHVPLLIKLPGNQDAGKRVRAKVGLTDVAPTLLEVAGVPVPAQMQGQSLLRIAKSGSDQPVYSRSDFPQRAFGWSSLESWRAGKYLYIRAPHAELYDLSADPGATHNLAQSSKAIADTMASQLSAFDRRFGDQAHGTATSLTSSEAQKLASLGYVGLQKPGGPATAATGTDPKDEIATANKVQSGFALANEGKADKSLEILQPAVGTSKMYLGQFAMGLALTQLQQWSKAVEHLHAAIESQPDSAWAHYYMGSCLIKTGDFKSAAVHLEIAATRLPEFADAHSSLAEAYDHLGRAEDAKKERSKAASKP